MPRFRTPALVLALFAGTLLPVALAGAESPALPQPANAAPARDLGELLPIRQITLYRSGVGAFQREGMVNDAKRIQLRFDVSQINDILKSLQLLDLDGGRIDSVSYPSKDPLSKRLSSFSVPIADEPSFPQLLARLRGSGIDIQTVEGNKLSGTILNVENRKVPGGGGKDAQPIDEPFVVLITSTGMRSVSISSIVSTQLQDKQLADELNRALMAVAEARADRIKTIDLSLNGAGDRRVVARYVHETPVWKTSYRMVISDSPEQKDRAGGKVPDTLTLQGWAIVENTTDSDWKDVKLSLVSGRPVSFTMDLSEPLYLARPDVPVPTIPGVMPKSYAGGSPVISGMVDGYGENLQDAAGNWDKRKAGAPPASMAPGQPRGGLSRAQALSEAGPAGTTGNSAVYFGVTADDLTKYSPAAAARAGEVGEVFFYEVSNPVTIERQRSAMIPFLASNVEGRRVSIFNLNDRPDHPMRGIEIKNTSGLQLLPGPLAVFDGTAYAGDATINQVSPGDKRLLAYALDLDVAVTTVPQQGGEITKLRIVDGLLEQTTKNVNALKYTFDNKDQKRSRTIIVEHTKFPGWDLKEPAKPIEETQALYRFEVTAEAGKQAVLTVRQEQVQSQRLEINSFDLGTVVRLNQEGRASAAVLKAIQQLSQLQAAVNESQRQVNDLNRQIEINTKEQDRVSTTLGRVPKESNVYADYMRDLSELNTSLRTLREAHKKKLAETEAKSRERDDFVKALNVE